MGSTLSSCLNKRPSTATPPPAEQQECDTPCLLSDLPPEIVFYYIFPHLNSFDLGRLSQVSKYFNKLINSDDLGNPLWSKQIEQQGFNTKHWRWEGMKFTNEKSKFRYLYLYERHKKREKERNCRQREEKRDHPRVEKWQRQRENERKHRQREEKREHQRKEKWECKREKERKRRQRKEKGDHSREQKWQRQREKEWCRMRITNNWKHYYSWE